MAPAVQQPDQQIYTSTHTTNVFQTAVLDHVIGPKTLSKRRHTLTETKMVTITLDEPIPTPSLSALYKPQPANILDSGTWPIMPQIHGIVPRAPLSSRSPSETPALIPAITTIASATPQYRPSNTLRPTTFGTSSYPRLSPPGFFYPETVRIVPLHINIPKVQYSMLGGAVNVIWYLPYGLEIPIFAFMLLGIVCMVLVWLVKFPLRKWYCNDIASSASSAKKKGGKKRRQMLLGWSGKERRPVDKPSKYAPSTSVPINTIETDKHTTRKELGHSNASTTATPTIYIHPNAHLPETDLTHRRRMINRRTSSTPSTAVEFSLSKPSPTTTTLSPPNPYLQPPDFLSPHKATALKPRNSSEWLADREKYFSLSSPTHSRTPSTTSSSASDAGSYEYEMDTAAMEALEAGVASLTPRSPAAHKREGSWVNLGLAKVEGAVNGFADRLARWTDEFDRGEKEERGLLLPVSELKGIKVE